MVCYPFPLQLNVLSFSCIAFTTEVYHLTNWAILFLWVECSELFCVWKILLPLKLSLVNPGNIFMYWFCQHMRLNYYSANFVTFGTWTLILRWTFRRREPAVEETEPWFEMEFCFYLNSYRCAPFSFSFYHLWRYKCFSSEKELCIGNLMSSRIVFITN